MSWFSKWFPGGKAKLTPSVHDLSDAEILARASTRLVAMMPKWGLDEAFPDGEPVHQLDSALINKIQKACNEHGWVVQKNGGYDWVNGSAPEADFFRKVCEVSSPNGDSRPLQVYACAVARDLATKGRLTPFVRRALLEECMSSVLMAFSTETFFAIETDEVHQRMANLFARAVLAEMDRIVEAQPRMFGLDPDDGVYESKLEDTLKLLRSRTGLQAFALCGTGVVSEHVFILSKVFNDPRRSGESFFAALGAAGGEASLRVEPYATVDNGPLSAPGVEPVDMRVHGYPLDYVFYLSPYTWEDLPVRLVDFCAPSLENEKRRSATTRVRNVGLRRATVLQVQQLLNEWLGQAVSITVYDVVPFRLGTSIGKKMTSDFKGTMRPVGWAPPHPGVGAQWDILKPEEQLKNVAQMRITSDNFLPEPENDGRMGGAAITHLGLYNAVEGLQRRGAGPVLGALASPKPGTRRTGLLHMLFKEHPQDVGYGAYAVFTGASLSSLAGVHLARFGTINRARSPEVTPDMLLLLTGGMHQAAPPPLDLEHPEQARSSVIIEDSEYYLALGSPDLGWVVFTVLAASKTPIRHAAIDEHGDTFDANAWRLQSVRKIEDYCRTHLRCERLVKSAQAVSQGELFSTKRGTESWYVKTFYEDHLKALRQVWPLLEARELLPPRLEAAYLNDLNENDPIHRDQAWVWLVLTPRFHTIQDLFNGAAGPLTEQRRVALRDALRRFYGKGLGAGLAFPDCSIEDLVVSKSGDTIFLIDFGSYEPFNGFKPSTNPGKADYKDPGTIARILGGTPFDATDKVRCHAYNLALLEYRLWGNGLIPEWTQRAEDLAGSQAAYDLAVESAMEELRETMVARGVTPEEALAVTTELSSMVSYEVSTRLWPAEWNEG